MSNNYWYSLFEKKGFNHCALIARNENFWLEINPADDILNLTPYVSDKDIINLYKKKFKRMNKSLRILYVVFNEYRELQKSYWLPSCVSIVLKAMSLRLFCITPYSLFKKLNKMSKKNKERYGISKIECL